MKHYLDFIPIAAKVHGKQSRMIRLCIVLAVFLVTAIFGMADMWIQAQRIQALQSDGSWHAAFQQINDEQAALLAARPDISTSAWYGVLNYNLDKPYQIGGINTVVCGMDETIQQLFPAAQIMEGSFPQDVHSAVITKNVQERLGVQIGEDIQLTTPTGDQYTFTVSGISGNTSLLMNKDALGIYVNTPAYRKLAESAGIGQADFYKSTFYVKFAPHCNIPKTLETIQTQFNFTDQQIAQNVKVLALMVQSKNSYILQLYLTAAMLALLVTIAGILMIAGSMNSNVAQRIEFFGRLRCLGATPKQVYIFVLREALFWCKSAIPLGLILGTATIWLLCAMLKFLSPNLFAGMPTFGVSWIAWASGSIIGLLTVLLAVRSPAKKAARVSPLTAVSGNAGTIQAVRKSADTNLFQVDTALGIHHAMGSKKNFCLMVGSFAFSIILFLAFSASIDFMHHAITPLKPYTPDLSVISPDNSCSISPALVQQLTQDAAVKRVYGRSFAYHLPAQIEGEERIINLISYESQQFGWAKKFLLEGSIEQAAENGGVLTVFDGSGSFDVAQTMTVNSASGAHSLQVAGMLSNSPFHQETGVETVICSEAVFQQIIGTSNYTILDIQLLKGATDADVARIRATAGDTFTFSDQRLSNGEVRGAYYSFVLFIYGFLAVIACISIFNIMNSIAMSVSARMKQYGMMRAIGMCNKQIANMVMAEAVTYAAFGILAGCLLGLPIHKFLYGALVTFQWGDAWYVPAGPLAVILTVVCFALAVAIYYPVKRICKLSVADTIRAD